MENKNIRDNNVFPVYVDYYLDNFEDESKKFASQYNSLLIGCFRGLYKRCNYDPAVVYTPLSEEQLGKLNDNFDYKSKFNEILFSEKSEIDYDQLLLLYEVFCLNVLYQKMLADELSKQGKNEANNFDQKKRQELDKLKDEIKNFAFCQNLFDELIHNLLEFKSDDDVIKFLFEKTFGSIEENQTQAKFDQMKKEILDCVGQVKTKEHPIICIANADNVDAEKNKDKYNKYTFVQWKKWDELPNFEKAYEKKLPDKNFNDVLSVGDGKIFGTDKMKSIKDEESQGAKELLSQCIDDYLDEKDGEYKNFFALIDYYLDFCSRERNFNNDSANNELFSVKKGYLWYSISDHLKVVFQNGKRDDFMNKFNNKFIENEKIKCKNEQAKTEIVNIIELSSTVQFGTIMTYDDDQYSIDNDDIYKDLLDNSQSNCLNYFEGNLYTKYSVSKITNELEYKNLCQKIIFKNEISKLDENDLSLIFEVFLLNVLYKKMSNINLAKDNDEITEDLDTIWNDKIENSILNQGLFDKFRQKLVSFQNEDNVIEFLYTETFYDINELDDKDKNFSTMKKEILDCVHALKNDKNPCIFFTDNKFVKEKYSSDKNKSCRIFVWERKDNLPAFKEKTTIKLKENIKDVLCAFDDYIFDDSNINGIKNEKIDFLLLSESIGDYLNAQNFCPGDETADSKKDGDDQPTSETKADNNFMYLIEYYCSFCAREKELSEENENSERHQLFNAKKKYLFGFIKSRFEIMRDNNRVKEFMIQFSSRFIENHKIKANNDTEKKEIANFINWLGKNGFYPHDESYLVVLDDEIYPTFTKYADLDVFFDIDLDKCTVKLKDEEFRSAIFNVLKNKTNTIERTELFKNFYERVMKDEKMSPEKKEECLNKIMPQLLKFISIYGLLDKTKMDHNDDPICYYVDFDRFDELTDLETPVDYYVDKLWADISYNSVNYYQKCCWDRDYIKILDVIKNMINNEKLTLRKDNVQIIKSLIKKFLLVGEDFAKSLKKKYLQASFKKTDANDITQSNEFKRLTLAFEIVSGLISDNKEHEIKKFFDDEIKKLFGLDGLKNSLLGFINPYSECKEIEFCLNYKDDIINKFVDSFKGAIEATKTSENLNSIEKVFAETEPDFDLAMSICERIFDEIMAYEAKRESTYGFWSKHQECFIYVIELLSSLLSSNHFKLDSEEKQKRVYILYSKIISYSKEKKNNVEHKLEQLEYQIMGKIYAESQFNLVKYYYDSGNMSLYYDKNNFERRDDKIAVVDNPSFRNQKQYCDNQTLLKELFKFEKWIDIVSSDKEFFAGFISEIIFHIESQDYKGKENDKNKFHGIYSIKSLAGYKSFQNDLDFGKLSKFDKRKQSEFIFDTDLFLSMKNFYLDNCLDINASLHKFLFQSDFTFVLPIDEITADKVNNAFAQYSQKLNENFENKEGDEYQKLKDDFLGLFAKALIGHCELILSNEKYHEGKNKDELKNDYIKTIATFCRDKETKIIRYVLESCTRTAEEQKNKFIKPYAIIEALLNDENFKLDAEKTALIIEWLVKYDVNALGIELKENENYNDLKVIDKLFKKIKTDKVELDHKIYNKLLNKKCTFIIDASGNSYNISSSINPALNKNPEDQVAYVIGNQICDELNYQARNKKKNQNKRQPQNNLTDQNKNLIQNNRNDNINNNVLKDTDSNQKIEENDKKTSSTFKMTKLVSFALITITGLILVLNSFIHMFSLSLFLSIPLILVCIIFDMALFENGRKILKSILKCIFCCNTKTDGNIGENNCRRDKSSIFNDQNEITGDNTNINLIKLKEPEKK